MANLAPFLKLSPSPRVRTSPFWPGVVDAGVVSCSVYNHMLLPTQYRSPEEDYRHLKTRVQLWDVSCERQVAVSGRDAADLLSLFFPRSIETMVTGRCYYVPAVDQFGRVLNDPLILKLASDSYWVSIADSDLILWIKGLSAGLGLDVDIHEPDVSPLAVQGPLSARLMERVFGPEVVRLRFFGFDRFGFDHRDYLVSRSGYSRQGGYEIYVDGSENGMTLWRALMDAGHDLDVGPGSPNYTERVEAGLLSFGGDISSKNNPYECGLGKYLDLENADRCLALEPLKRIREQGPERMIRSLSISGPPVPNCQDPWRLSKNGEFAGKVTAATWSWDHNQNVAIAMVEAPYWDAETCLEVELPDATAEATVRSGFFS